MPAPASRCGMSQTIEKTATTGYSITGAPRVVKGRCSSARAAPNSACAATSPPTTPRPASWYWRWYIVPGNPPRALREPADGGGRQDLERRPGGKTGGGGAPWDRHHLRSEDRLCCSSGTGNGAPWPAEIRGPGSKGDHLFLSSIVALKPDTGEYVWHYQMTPRDSWDYAAIQQITVADLKIDGQKRHVVDAGARRTASSTCWTRTTGELHLRAAVRTGRRTGPTAST